MITEHLDFLSVLFPFRGIERSRIEKMFSSIGFEIRSYKKGQTVVNEGSRMHEIGFVYDGECIIENVHDKDNAVPLNTVSRLGSFGILSVINGDEDFPTRVKASSNAKVLFIRSEDMLAMIEGNGAVAMNVIRFLAGRISFLNGKIDTFSGKSTLSRLASYLYSQYMQLGESFTVSKTELARRIGVGRASLYRDMNQLEKDGILATEQKRIIILRPDGLERIQK
jgi:CRP-like cAMP-binding protein